MVSGYGVGYVAGCSVWRLFSLTVVITIILDAVALLLCLAALLLFKNMYNTMRAITTALPAIKIPILHPVHSVLESLLEEDLDPPLRPRPKQGETANIE